MQQRPEAEGHAAVAVAPRARVGCASWSIPIPLAEQFPGAGPHLARYVGPSFRFSVQLPEGSPTAGAWSTSTSRSRGSWRRRRHSARDVGRCSCSCRPAWPSTPSWPSSFLVVLEGRHDGPVICEPWHPSWFGAPADELLRVRRVARVAADPAPVPGRLRPAAGPGWSTVASTAAR